MKRVGLLVALRAMFGVDRQPSLMVKQRCPTCGRASTFKSWRDSQQRAIDAYVRGDIEVDGLERMLDATLEGDPS